MALRRFNVLVGASHVRRQGLPNGEPQRATGPDLSHRRVGEAPSGAPRRPKRAGVPKPPRGHGSAGLRPPLRPRLQTPPPIGRKLFGPGERQPRRTPGCSARAAEEASPSTRCLATTGSSTPTSANALVRSSGIWDLIARNRSTAETRAKTRLAADHPLSMCHWSVALLC